MSSRHHIDDFMRGRIIVKIEEKRKITDVAREFDIAHSIVSRLWKSFKTTGMCSRRHGGGRVRSMTPADLSSYQQKGTGAPKLSSTVLPVCNGVVSITIGLNRTGHVYYSQMSRFSLSSDCRRQLIWREWYCLSSRKYPGKGPISDMQYHGVGRHHDQWPHAPTCGCEWDYDRPLIH
ncbi:uncharacterized protein TNCV_4671121 [Trichonephila clavipes]|nr:uncharacterized protein TNCV_4671121 [Trichonephila clavipes]